jgi:hypothetical protein
MKKQVHRSRATTKFAGICWMDEDFRSKQIPDCGIQNAGKNFQSAAGGSEEPVWGEAVQTNQIDSGLKNITAA